MAVHEPLSRDEQDRLAALWEQPLDDDRAVDTTDDVIAALFVAPGIDEPPTTSRSRTGATRRSHARRRSVGGDRGREQPRHADPRAGAGWVVAGVALLIGLGVPAIALLDGTTGSTDTRAPNSSTTAPRAAAPDPPARTSPATLDPRRARIVGLRPQRAHRRPARAARSGRARSRIAQRPRTAPTRARRPAHSVRPRSEPPATPSTVRPPKAPIPTAPSSSSACDEFPPC